MIYKTTYVTNLFTGESLTLEIPGRNIAELEKKKKRISSGQTSIPVTIEELTQNYEFSFFPAFELMCGIWIENGYTSELMSQILNDFGVPENFAEKLLEDEEFVNKLKPLFEGINCDDGRALRTLKSIYNQIKGYFSLKQNPALPFP